MRLMAKVLQKCHSWYLWAFPPPAIVTDYACFCSFNSLLPVYVCQRGNLKAAHTDNGPNQRAVGLTRLKYPVITGWCKRADDNCVYASVLGDRHGT